MPSLLFTLFKRGKYCSRRPISSESGDGEEKAIVERERKEAERFAVAAVAFCLNYDKPFKEHFWRVVCRFPGDPQLTSDSKILVEENQWADLKIANGSHIYVVEFKIRAPLADKQNPNKDAFWQEGGYGSKMRLDPQHTYHYIILDQSESFQLDHRPCRNNVQCRSRKWTDLNGATRPSRLLHDLFDCLGSLSVSNFESMKAKKISIGAGIRNVGDAFVVLNAVSDSLGVKTKFDCSRSEQSAWWIGYNILRRGSAMNTRQLQKRTNNKSKILAWFGFQGSEGSPTERAVWLYCGDRKRANRASKLVPSADDPQKYDWCGWAVEIVCELGREPSDYDWFLSVFEKLGVRPAG
jgi:hypothetical protein